MAKTNAEKQAAYRARKKASATTPAPDVTPVDASVLDDVADTLNVEVKTNEPAPALSLKEKLLKRLQGDSPAPSVRQPARRGKKQENLLTSTLPTVLCAFIATYSQSLLPDPYKPCAPTQMEATGMLGPLMDILARNIEITGKASQTTIDIMNSVICTLMYGIRAYMTYMQIKEKETPHHEKSKTASDPKPTSLRTYQDTANGVGRDNDSGYADEAHAPTATPNDARGNTDTPDGATEGRDREAAQISDLFSRDRQGRVRLGLLAS